MNNKTSVNLTEEHDNIDVSKSKPSFFQTETYYLVRRLFVSYVMPYKLMLLGAMIFMALIAATNGIQSLMVEVMMDKVFIAKNMTFLYISVAIFVVNSLARGIGYQVQNYLMQYIGQKIVKTLQIELYKKLVYSDFDLVSSQASGKIIAKFTNDIILIRTAISDVLASVIRDSLTAIILIGVMFYQSVELSLLVFILFPTAIYPIMRIGIKLRALAAKTQAGIGEYTAKLDDSLALIKVIKSFNHEEYEIGLAENRNEHLFKLYMQAAKIFTLISPIMEGLVGIGIGALVLYGGMQVLDNALTPGEFFSFVTSFLLAYRPVKSISFLNSPIQNGLAATKRIFEVLDTQNTIISAPDATILEGDRLDIEFDHVSFSYPSYSDILVLNNLNFSIKHGQTIAIVGGSGSGKTTLVNLLLRFYDVNSGFIKLNGHDVRNLTIESLRQKIALVSQDITLFDASIADNIAYGAHDIEKVTQEEIEKISAIVGIDEFVANFEHGYNSLIGQNGNNLSGGQRQRIALARALLKDSPILILDEATSSLDNISERKIQSVLESMRGQKTIIIIAHRLSTIENADMIYVMKNGQIVESGTHKELINVGQEYSKLYNRPNEDF